MFIAGRTRSIVIIGGGVSGTLVAVNVLRLAKAGTRIALVEKSPPIGRGVAYGTDQSEHLLNVPAGRMSVWPEDPEHFLRWMGERLGRVGYPDAVASGDFLPRRLFGDYVASVFAAARQNVAADVNIDVVVGEAVDVEECNDGTARVVLADQRVLAADRVVLALGVLPGEYPIRRSLRFFHGPRYVHIPWQSEALEGVGKRDDVLIVGQGLTSLDIIVQLERLGHVGKIHAVSRRGLRPQVHRLGPAWSPFFAGKPFPRTVRALFRRVREEVATAAGKGIDWRAVIDAIRPQSAELWSALSWEERARFMRHVRPFWEVHRHRLPPPTASRVDRLVALGRLEFFAGRLESLVDEGPVAEAVIRLRGKDERRVLRVAKVINCTGPRSDYSKYQHPLLINLLARGLIDHDPLALGLHAMPSGEVFRYRGGPLPWLYTLGAPLKGTLWESTAVPEIRVHAAMIARSLVAD